VARAAQVRLHLGRRRLRVDLRPEAVRHVHAKRSCESVDLDARSGEAQKAVVAERDLHLASGDQPAEGLREVPDAAPVEPLVRSQRKRTAHPGCHGLGGHVAALEHERRDLRGAIPQPAEPLARGGRARSISSRELRLCELAEQRLELGDGAGSHEAAAAAMDPLERDLDGCAFAQNNAGQVGEQVPGGDQRAAARVDAEMGRDIGDVAGERAGPDPGVIGDAEGEQAGRRSSAGGWDPTGDRLEVRGEVDTRDVGDLGTRTSFLRHWQRAGRGRDALEAVHEGFVLAVVGGWTPEAGQVVGVRAGASVRSRNNATRRTRARARQRGLA
jgi:hypothetical protein